MRTFALSVFLFLMTSSLTVAQFNDLNKVDYSKDVIYQIVTDRFPDGDPTNNSSNIEWETGNNHTIVTPSEGIDTVIVNWQQ